MPFVDALSALFSILVDFAVIGAVGKSMLEVFPERQPEQQKACKDKCSNRQIRHATIQCVRFGQLKSSVKPECRGEIRWIR